MAEKLTPTPTPDKETQEEYLDKLGLIFEAEWGDYRKSRTVIRNEDGSKSSYETYKIPLFSDDSLVADYIRDIGHIASVLGYRSTIGPIVIPETQTFFGKRDNERPYVLLFLEHIIKM